MMRSLVWIVVPLLAGASHQQVRGRSPAYASDGRLAIAVRGDLWVLPASGRSGAPARVTTGPAWDRDPAWTPDGAIVFASDRDGGLDLYRVSIDAGGEVERLTTSPEADSNPAVGPDGRIVFVRGTGPAADLWERTAAGTERRLTDEPGGEVEPAISAAGRVAYVKLTAERALYVLNEDGADVRVDTGTGAENPAWSPDGRRIVFSTGGRSPGLWITSDEGAWLALASRERAEAAWSPDGEWLAMSEAAPADVGYNGDPARVADRTSDGFRTDPELKLVRAPAPPASGTPVDGTLANDRASVNANAYDRVRARIADLYFRGDSPWARESLAKWEAAAARHRSRALEADDDAALESAIHALIAERPPLRPSASGSAAVSSAHPLATAAGVEIFEAGGNVVDAAVAVSFALGVVEPDASGPGGYGEMLIHIDGMAEPVAIEFMTRLPEAYNDALDAVRAGDPHGALLANVPGTVAGMETAWKRFGSGRLPWARLLEPAIRIAENGFVIDDGFGTTLARERLEFARYESSRALFFRDGAPLQVGDTLRNPDLAWTLRQIAGGGAAAFYDGAIAERLVADLRARGNPVTREDLRRYFAAERRPIRTTYRGHSIYSGPPPVTGGAVLAGKLNLLELANAGRSPTDDATGLHAILEAWALQPSTGDRIADPDLWPTDVTPFESKDTAVARWRCFDPERASRPNAVQRGCATAASTRDAGPASPAPIPESAEDPSLPCAVRDPRTCRNTGTTSFAVADGAGNAVSVTQTLGTWGGNFYVTPGLGFLYNDKYTSYRSDPDAYGTRLPYARNTTIISPTIIYDGSGPGRKPLAAIGAAGNAWITSAVFAMVIGIIDHDMGPQQALELPRMLPGGNGIQMEDGFAPDAIARLEAMGHEFRRISLKGELRMGYGAAVVIRDGTATAGADPRRSGAAGAAR